MIDVRFRAANLDRRLSARAGNRLIGLPIPDTQRKNPRSVGKGRFVEFPGFTGDVSDVV